MPVGLMYAMVHFIQQLEDHQVLVKDPFQHHQDLVNLVKDLSLHPLAQDHQLLLLPRQVELLIGVYVLQVQHVQYKDQHAAPQLMVNHQQTCAHQLQDQIFL